MSAERSDAGERPREGGIYVLAGVNGSGKSSIVGTRLRREGADYFNPDEETRRLLASNSALTSDGANGAAWLEGKRRLERAIADRLEFRFETTLGGNTIVRTLETALDAGIEVRMWFVGLSSPEQHLARIRARVAAGGHDIPEEKVRERFDASRQNLIRLLPRLTELRLYDNSFDADPIGGVAPRPRLLLHLAAGRVMATCELATVPNWAKPIMLVALHPR